MNIVLVILWGLLVTGCLVLAWVIIRPDKRRTNDDHP